MTLQPSVERQRIRHIIRSYHLAGQEIESFERSLDNLSEQYSSAIVEWAIVETLVVAWLRFPLPRGNDFLECLRERLDRYFGDGVGFTVSAEQFRHIAGFDPAIVPGDRQWGSPAVWFSPPNRPS